MHYYPHHIGDYRSSTSHLSNEEDLTYRRLLEMYYDSEQPIPLETNWVARRLRVGCESVVAVLNDFFEKRENGWYHAKCEKIIKKYHSQAVIARENGKKGGRRKAAPNNDVNPAGSKSVPSPKPDLSQPLANQEPVTSNQEPVTKNQLFKEKKQQAEKPADVDEQTWRDFVSHRKNKKASITKTAISGIRKEAEKAGISLTEALSICVIRGWIGFDATWLKNNQNSNQKPKEKTLIEKMLEAEDRKSKTFDVQATELVTKQSGDNYLAITEEARDE